MTFEGWSRVRSPYGQQPPTRSGQQMTERAPAVMPCLAAEGTHHGYGAPRITERRLELAQQTAWLVDLVGWSRRSVARAYHGSAGTGGAEVQAVKRDLAAMRRYHWERGVIPWALWPAGAVPAKWWASDRWALWTATRPTLAGTALAATRRATRQIAMTASPNPANTYWGVLAQLSVLLEDAAGDPPEVDQLREQLDPCMARELLAYLLRWGAAPARTTP